MLLINAFAPTSDLSMHGPALKQHTLRTEQRCIITQVPELPLDDLYSGKIQVAQKKH